MQLKLDQNAVLKCLPERKADSHKGDYGKILLICGSKGYTGAPSLAAMGALRTGAGLVFLAVPDCIYPIEAAKLEEAVVLPLPSGRGKLSVFSAGRIKKMLQGKTAVLIGPGLGQSAGALRAVKTVLKHCNCPVVVDADGINVLQAHIDILRDRTSPTILTPHPGEFTRIAGACDDRCSAAMRAARDLNVIMVLKGHETLITDGAICYKNPTGNPGMAVGGCGDILAGMITSLLGQGLSPLRAAACAVWLHGAAGDICAGEIGQYGMLPTDMLQVLPRLMK